MSGPGRSWAVVTAASGTVLIGGGAFWLSFTALADLAVRSGIAPGQAWIWPLLVDGLIVVATVAVVALDGHRSAWYPWALLIAGALVSVTANAAHALVAADAAVPGMLAATVASVPPLVLLASTHLTVVLIRSTRPHTPATVRSDASDAPVVEQAPVPSPPEHIDIDARPVTRSVLTEPEHLGAGDEATATAPFALADAEPRTSEGARGDVRRARAASLRDAGWSNKQIARELDVHPSTVGRWLPRPSNTDPRTEAHEASGPVGPGRTPDLTEEETP